jgi:hypothetical protein
MPLNPVLNNYSNCIHDWERVEGKNMPEIDNIRQPLQLPKMTI